MDGSAKRATQAPGYWSALGGLLRSWWTVLALASGVLARAESLIEVDALLLPDWIRPGALIWQVIFYASVVLIAARRVQVMQRQERASLDALALDNRLMDEGKAESLRGTALSIGSLWKSNGAKVLSDYYPSFLDGSSAGALMCDILEFELGLFTSAGSPTPSQVGAITAKEEEEFARSLTDLLLDAELSGYMERVDEERVGSPSFDYRAVFRFTSSGKRLLALMQSTPRTS